MKDEGKGKLPAEKLEAEEYSNRPPMIDQNESSVVAPANWYLTASILKALRLCGSLKKSSRQWGRTAVPKSTLREILLQEMKIASKMRKQHLQINKA